MLLTVSVVALYKIICYYLGVSELILTILQIINETHSLSFEAKHFNT